MLRQKQHQGQAEDQDQDLLLLLHHLHHFLQLLRLFLHLLTVGTFIACGFLFNMLRTTTQCWRGERGGRVSSILWLMLRGRACQDLIALSSLQQGRVIFQSCQPVSVPSSPAEKCPDSPGVLVALGRPEGSSSHLCQVKTASSLQCLFIKLKLLISAYRATS